MVRVTSMPVARTVIVAVAIMSAWRIVAILVALAVSVTIVIPMMADKRENKTQVDGYTAMPSTRMDGQRNRQSETQCSNCGNERFFQG